MHVGLAQQGGWLLVLVLIRGFGLQVLLLLCSHAWR